MNSDAVFLTVKLEFTQINSKVFVIKETNLFAVSTLNNVLRVRDARQVNRLAQNIIYSDPFVFQK